MLGEAVGLRFSYNIGFNLACTNLFLMDGLFLYAITGGSVKIFFNILLFWVSLQCF